MPTSTTSSTRTAKQAAPGAKPGGRRPYAPRVPIAERREQILDAAIRIIVRDGYSAVSIESIAREAGVTRPVVYGAYDGLWPLMIALLDRQQERAVTQLFATLPSAEQLVGGAAQVADVLERTVHDLVTMIRDDPTTWQPIVTARSNAPAEVRDRVEGDWERVRAYVQGLLELLLVGRPGQDAELLSHTVVAAMEHFGRILVETPDRFSPERFAAALRALI